MKKLIFPLLLLFSMITVAQPPVTTGLTLHLDASTGLTGSSPATWEDQSGNGNDVTTNMSLGSDPTATTGVNGYPAIRFDDNCIMTTVSTAEIVTGTGGTIFVVVEAGDQGSPLSITQPPTNYMGEEMTIVNNYAYHNSLPHSYQGRTHQCVNSITSGSLVIKSVVFGSGVTDMDFYINGVLTTEVCNQNNLTNYDDDANNNPPVAYSSVDRIAHVGSRINEDVELQADYDGEIYEILVYDRELTSTEVAAVTSYLKCKYEINYTVCNDGDLTCDYISCDDVCDWRVAGNTIYNNRNILGTLSNDHIRIQTNATERMRLTNDGKLGVGVTAPSARLHVDLTGLTSTTGLRFQGLATSSNTNFLVTDANGNVTVNTGSSIGNLTNSCSTTNRLLRLDGTNTTSCSVIEDDGSNVGVSTAASGTWTGGGAGTIGMPSNPTTVKLDVGGMVRCSTLVVISDKNSKTNVSPITGALEKVLALNGVSYNWINNNKEGHSYDASRQYGFLAQDVSKIVPEAVGYDANGGYGMNYLAIIPVLTEAIKEQQTSINEIKAENEELKKLLQDVCYYGCDKLDLSGLNNTANPMGAYLEQNMPNPSKGETTFSYNVPAEMNAQSVKILVTDLLGKTLASLPVEGNGLGKVNFTTTNLAAGIYNYSLIVDGNVIDTKKMVVE